MFNLCFSNICNLVILIIAFGVCNINCVLSKNKLECGYKQCPQTRDGALNVHLIPHSHMDAGWVKTFDEYYYGTKTTVSTANVQLIYHSVLSELLHDKRRKFTFSETAYFWRWWKEQRPSTRATFRSLVQEGRVEFAGGAWVHNDEATPDYLQIIDQFTWGLRKLNDTLGPCGKPKVAWQIDTYGHTREQASLLAQMGYDGLFIGRVDHKEREAMIEEDRMEFMWRGSDVLGKMSDIMTHTLFNLYNAPDGFCFDFLCNDEPIIDDPDNKVYNAEKRVNEFIQQIERQAKYYDHDNIMVTMGGDFTYQSAANWFMNMDKLINHVNTHPANLSDIHIFYSTPSCYLKAIYLYGRRDKTVFTEKGDHLPYGSDANTYWTGYYSSRPSLKYLARKAHVFLQVVKQLTVLSRAGDSYELHLLRHAVSLVLHHDAITGTSQQHVTNEFIRTLSEAIDSCTKKVSNLLSYLTPTWGASRRSKNNQLFVTCHQLNMSQCRFTETQETMMLVVYNPLSIKTYHYVRIPAIALHYTIRDHNDDEVEYQLVPLPAAVINLPGRNSLAIQELCFEAENIPPLGYSTFYISPIRDQLEENAFAKKQANPENEQELVPHISNEYIKVAVDPTSGLLESIQHVDGVKIQVSQNFYYYSQTQQTLQSGAYSFRPETSRPSPATEKVAYHVVRGTLVKEIRQKFNDWISQTIRLYRGEEFVEMEWVIGPVPVGTDLGKEVVTVFVTNITNNGEFYTDTNSRLMMRRTCWNESSSQQQKKPVAACYYPVTSRICIRSQNSSVEMCVLPDRTQGGVSYNEGEIELMLHRRLLTDDGFGLEESLNEEAYGAGLVIRGRHRIFFGNFRQEMDDQTFSERSAQSAKRFLMEPWLFFTSGEKINRRKWQNMRNKRYTALRLHGLPRHISVLTLEPWKGGSVLLRLENTLESTFKTTKDNSDDYPSKSSHITVELRKLFLQHNIRMVRETTLAANQWLEDARQMDWSTRYVYNGGDDGLQPEDLEYGEDKIGRQTADKEQSRSSEEDKETQQVTPNRPRRIKQDKTRSRPSRNREPRNYGDYENRRKRSINITENLIENILNDTFSKVKDGDKIDNTTVTVDVTTVTDYPTTKIECSTKLNVVYNKTTKADRPTTKPKLTFLSSKMKPKITDWRRNSKEIDASEEDFSSNMRKRSPRRKEGNRGAKRSRRIFSDAFVDDTDDGITKSIYEMYYKSKPRKTSFKPMLRSSEEVTEEPRRKKKKKNKGRRYQEDVKPRKTRAKKRRVQTIDMPFFISDGGKRYKEMRKRKEMRDIGDRETIRGYLERMEEDASQEGGYTPASRVEQSYSRGKKRKDVLESDDYEGEVANEDRDAEESEERNEKRRKKRTISKDEDPTPEPTSEPAEHAEDYVITLRPTQIRTFVIWFEDNKKAYTI